MLGNGHVRFGRRAAETDQSKDRHRAAARPHTHWPLADGTETEILNIIDDHSRLLVGSTARTILKPDTSSPTCTWQ
jgi:hypothetical protein